MDARAHTTTGAPEADDDEPGGLVVEHYRLDPTRALSRALGAGAAVVTLGALLMGLAILLPRFDARPDRPALPARAAIFRGAEVTADGKPVPSRTSSWEIALGVLGLLCIVGGGAGAIIGLRGVMTEESYLALRTDGAYFRHDGERSLLPWHEVETVRWDPNARAVVFVRHDGSTWTRAERYSGTDGSTLAKRAAEVRRKALFGLLR